VKQWSQLTWIEEAALALVLWLVALQTASRESSGKPSRSVR